LLEDLLEVVGIARNDVRPDLGVPDIGIAEEPERGQITMDRRQDR
jgi:hypothetical protein